MRKSSKTEAGDRADCDVFTEVLRTGVRKLIAQALEAELAAYAEQRDEQGRALVVRSGHHPERDIQTGIVQEIRVRHEY